MPKFSDRSTSLEDFHSLHEVHRSAGGTVYTAYHKSDRTTRYILKERKVPELGRAKDIMNEVHLLSRLDSPYVVQCLGWFYNDRSKSLWLVLEYCQGGDLSTFIRTTKTRKSTINEAQIWDIFNQICLGVKCLHENGIVHRDLKSLNILCCDESAARLKIGDLGVGRQMTEHTELMRSRYGTPLYLSPELVDEQAKGYTEKTDIWSLGVILYELAALDTPFMSDSLLGLARKILRGKYAPIPPQYSDELSACISWLLCRDPESRPNISQLCRYLAEKEAAAAAAIAVAAGTVAAAARTQKEADEREGLGASSDTDSEGSFDASRVSLVESTSKRTANDDLRSQEARRSLADPRTAPDPPPSRHRHRHTGTRAGPQDTSVGDIPPGGVQAAERRDRPPSLATKEPSRSNPQPQPQPHSQPQLQSEIHLQPRSQSLSQPQSHSQLHSQPRSHSQSHSQSQHSELHLPSQSHSQPHSHPQPQPRAQLQPQLQQSAEAALAKETSGTATDRCPAPKMATDAMRLHAMAAALQRAAEKVVGEMEMTTDMTRATAPTEAKLSTVAALVAAPVADPLASASASDVVEVGRVRELSPRRSRSNVNDQMKKEEVGQSPAAPEKAAAPPPRPVLDDPPADDGRIHVGSVRLLIILKRETATLKRLLQTRSLLVAGPGQEDHPADALLAAIRGSEARIAVLKKAIQNGGYVATTDGFENIDNRGRNSPEIVRVDPRPARTAAPAAVPPQNSRIKAVSTGRKQPNLPDVLLLPNIKTAPDEQLVDSWRPGAVSRGPILRDGDAYPPSSPPRSNGAPNARRRRPQTGHGSSKTRQYDIFHRVPDDCNANMFDGIDADLAGGAAAAYPYPPTSQQGKRRGVDGAVSAHVRDDLALVDIIRKGAPKTPYPCFSEKELAVFPDREPKPRRQKFRTIIVDNA